MKSKVKEFLNSNKVCVVSTNEPYAASLFYVYDELNESLIFISSPNSRHIRLDKTVSVAIYNENPIKGVQIIAKLFLANDYQKKIYLDTFKSARFAIKHEIYALKMTYLKYTDNTLVLPKKYEINYE